MSQCRCGHSYGDHVHKYGSLDCYGCWGCFRAGIFREMCQRFESKPIRQQESTHEL